MCGIVGYIGKKQAAPVLLSGLKKLEYRGYDSEGIAVLSQGKFTVKKEKGRVEALGGGEEIEGNVGIGHTRWATHGAPSKENAHPHSFGRFALVHNGVIENARELKEECLQRGESFLSETDSEVIAHLLERYYEGDLPACVAAATKRLKGSYALAILCTEESQTIVCVRCKSPLIVGKTAQNELILASDIPAIAEDGARYCTLCDGDIALLKEGEIRIFDARSNPVRREFFTCDCDNAAPEKNGYPHFMRKEIDEIPFAMRNSMPDFASNSEYSAFYRVLCHAKYIYFVACGTAYHSGLCAARAFENICRVPCGVFLASEFRYGNPFVEEGSLVIAISQSGETADTLAAAQLVKKRGAYLAAVTNVRYSSLTTVADCCIFTNAGREIAVAATKSFNAQLTALYAMVCARAHFYNRKIECKDLPALASLTLKESEKVRAWAEEFTKARCAFFIGRDADFCTAREGSLKLKEITYIPSEGYAAGELKHGTLALVDESTPVVAIVTRRATAEKTMNAVHETYARGAKVFLITAFPELCSYKEVFASVIVPACEEDFSPALSVIPLQMLAYFVSVALGNDPDKPRNLAKSVTVE